MGNVSLKLAATGAAVVLVVVGCGGSARPTSTVPPASLVPAPTVATPARPSVDPPLPDTSIHSVPLEDVVFDTFDGGFVRLSDARPEQIRALRDAIRPIYAPRYEGPEGGDWLRPDDLVLGYEGNSVAFAYPIKMLNFHEIVHDTVDGVPLLATYCPLCGSGVVYDRRLDGETQVFGNTSALFENDLVMFDHETGSYWFQTGGEAIVGALTGRRLDVLPSAMLTWNDWLALHPDTRVLSRDQGFARAPSYDRDPFAGYAQLVDDGRFPFPLSTETLDGRLRPSTVVVSVKVGGTEKAYPGADLDGAAINDAIGGEPILVVSRDGLTARTFSRDVGGRTLTFELRDDRTVDLETGSVWDAAGRAVDGPLAGEALRPLPARRAFWFSLSIAVPGIPIYQP